MPPSGDDAAEENAAASDGTGENAPASDAERENAPASDAERENALTGDATGETVDGDAGDDEEAGGVDGQSGGAEAALSAAVDAADGDPDCALCSKPADYFLYETGRVEKFVCWEHVSPHSAAVDSEDARPGRPVALSL